MNDQIMALFTPRAAVVLMSSIIGNGVRRQARTRENIYDADWIYPHCGVLDLTREVQQP